MTKYIIGEIHSSGGATLYKNPSDQTVWSEEKFSKNVDFSLWGNLVQTHLWSWIFSSSCLIIVAFEHKISQCNVHCSNYIDKISSKNGQKNWEKMKKTSGLSVKTKLIITILARNTTTTTDGVVLKKLAFQMVGFSSSLIWNDGLQIE